MESKVKKDEERVLVPENKGESRLSDIKMRARG